MKFKKLAVALLVVAGSAQAGFGRDIGSSFIGSSLSNAFFSAPRRTEVVHVTESSSSNTTNKAVRNVQTDLDNLYDQVRKSFRKVADQMDEIQSGMNELAKKVNQLEGK